MPINCGQSQQVDGASFDTLTAIAFLTPYLTTLTTPFSTSLTTTVSANAAVGGFKPPPQGASKGLPSSLKQHCLQTLYLYRAPFSVRDTRKRNPAKLDLNTGTRRQRRRIARLA
jgi:hypothetical protein